MGEEEAESSSENVVFGVHLNYCADLIDAIGNSQQHGFGFVVVPLVHPRYKRDTIGVSSQRWINLDSPSDKIRENSEVVLKQEAHWGAHLSLPAVLAPAPTSLQCTNYARALNEVVNESRLQVWVNIPLKWDSNEPIETENTPWDAWNKLHRLTGLSTSIHVALFITADLPDDDEIRRWLGEPIRSAFLPTSIFKTNRMGYPVLTWRHQSLVVNLHRHKVQLVVSGRARHQDGLRPYQMYLRHLLNKIPPLSQMESFEAPYRDYLQSPLQPLMDNLESQTYETFEKDPIKYEQYEKAVEAALADTPETKVSVIMVVGAGRGPLVRASLRAAESIGRNIRMYAIEKNPNAVVTLLDMHRQQGWGNKVTIVHTDMRVWEAPEEADILVSELLGSWGDNELSPECLDGAQKFLKKDGGISIPYQYTSFVSPVSTAKLWNDVSAFNEIKHFETIYVVKLFNFFEVASAKPCFTFDHPNYLNPGKNERFATLTFKAEKAATIHGFAGYFEAKLYKDIDISINPETFSEGMFSWFPAYIPIKNPVHIKAGEIISASFWRRCTPTKVWYEWAVEEPVVTHLHNPNGRSYTVGLSSG